MLRKLSRVLSHLILSIPIICSIFFVGLTSIEALSPESNGQNPLKIVIEPSEENQSLDPDTSMDEIKMGGIPDLGDDQVFPFVAGLDSYEGS